MDILNLDAYGYLDNLALYPAELRAYLDRGGAIAWGIVPNTDDIFSVTAEQIAQKLQAGLALIGEKAAARGVQITVNELAHRSLLVPGCGLGPATPEIADAALAMLGAVKAALV